MLNQQTFSNIYLPFNVFPTLGKNPDSVPCDENR